MSLINSDENKTFGVVLRTPVEDSTGIPHILEHSVLCGSRKYPIKAAPAPSRALIAHPLQDLCPLRGALNPGVLAAAAWPQ